MCASLEAEVAGEKPHEDTGRKCKLHTDSAQVQELNPQPSSREMLTTSPPRSDILSLCCLLIGLIQTSQPLFAEPAKVNRANVSVDCPQFIVGEDGTCGLVYEHSPAEGPPIVFLIDYVVKYM